MWKGIIGKCKDKERSTDESGWYDVVTVVLQLSSLCCSIYSNSMLDERDKTGPKTHTNTRTHTHRQRQVKHRVWHKYWTTISSINNISNTNTFFFCYQWFTDEKAENQILKQVILHQYCKVMVSKIPKVLCSAICYRYVYFLWKTSDSAAVTGFFSNEYRGRQCCPPCSYWTLSVFYISPGYKKTKKTDLFRNLYYHKKYIQVSNIN